MGAVHRLPAGDELEEEDAEGEHVRLLVHDAVREVLGRQAPVNAYRLGAATPCPSCQRHRPVSLAKSKETGYLSGRKKEKLGSPERSLDGRDGVVRPLRRQPPGEAEVRNLAAPEKAGSAMASVDGRKQSWRGGEQHLRLVVGGEKDVGRLDVAVDDPARAALVEVAQPVRRADRDPVPLLPRHHRQLQVCDW